MYKFASKKYTIEQPQVTGMEQQSNWNFFNLNEDQDRAMDKPLTSWQDIYRPIGYPKGSGDSFISTEYGKSYDSQTKNFASTLSLEHGSTQWH